ncbi:MAG: hypothetical protein KGH74_04510 [Candidatus Micrarchaeota archaeon]|nr:hypothetical protein [Candidatus Micrarchaeota archaeon]MDE1824530.1 hypothetical protein [Candidatus Micrarchaeota archaeon]
MGKLQSAMEYLISYGWAILALSIVLTIVASYGFLNASITVKCLIPEGLVCKSPALSTTGNLTMTLQNTNAYPITITALGCGTNSTIKNYALQSTVIQSGSQSSMKVQCYAGSTAFTGTVNTQFNGGLGVNFTETQSGVKHSVIGQIAIKIVK